MLVDLGSAVLLLTIGSVALFAMVGEDSARMAEAGSRPRSIAIGPLVGALLGRVPDTWPAELATERKGQSVDFSSAALIFQVGQLLSAHMFHDVAALRAKVIEALAQGLPQRDREAVLKS